MAIRKAAAYSKQNTRPYTRNSRSKSKAYIKTVPYSKIVKFKMGDQKAFMDKKHKYVLTMLAEQGIMIRDNALESGRMLLHKILEEKIPGQYFMSVKVYPHHMLRENKTAAGAGADRVSTGMTQSFGVVIGRAAMVNPGKEIFIVACSTDKGARLARTLLTRIKAKLPCSSRILFSGPQMKSQEDEE